RDRTALSAAPLAKLRAARKRLSGPGVRARIRFPRRRERIRALTPIFLSTIELAALEQAHEIARAADQDSFDEHHRQRRPARPHLEREPTGPAAEGAAVLKIPVREPGVVEELPRLLGKRILPRADHHDLIPRHRVLHFL